MEWCPWVMSFDGFQSSLLQYNQLRQKQIVGNEMKSKERIEVVVLRLVAWKETGETQMDGLRRLFDGMLLNYISTVNSLIQISDNMPMVSFNRVRESKSQTPTRTYQNGNKLSEKRCLNLGFRKKSDQMKQPNKENIHPNIRDIKESRVKSHHVKHPQESNKNQDSTKHSQEHSKNQYHQQHSNKSPQEHTKSPIKKVLSIKNHHGKLKLEKSNHKEKVSEYMSTHAKNSNESSKKQCSPKAPEHHSEYDITPFQVEKTLASSKKIQINLDRFDLDLDVNLSLNRSTATKKEEIQLRRSVEPKQTQISRNGSSKKKKKQVMGQDNHHNPMTDVEVVPCKLELPSCKSELPASKLESQVQCCYKHLQKEAKYLVISGQQSLHCCTKCAVYLVTQGHQAIQLSKSQGATLQQLRSKQIHKFLSQLDLIDPQLKSYQSQLNIASQSIKQSFCQQQNTINQYYLHIQSTISSYHQQALTQLNLHIQTFSNCILSLKRQISSIQQDMYFIRGDIAPNMQSILNQQNLSQKTFNAILAQYYAKLHKMTGFIKGREGSDVRFMGVDQMAIGGAVEGLAGFKMQWRDRKERVGGDRRKSREGRQDNGDHRFVVNDGCEMFRVSFGREIESPTFRNSQS